MRILVFSALGLMVAGLIFMWLLTFVRYQITRTHLKITWLGVPVRRIKLETIESVSKRRGTGLAENWWNTARPGHRMLVIRRNRGFFRNFVITPRNRYVFRTDLERAIQQSKSPSAHENKTSMVSE